MTVRDMLPPLTIILCRSTSCQFADSANRVVTSADFAETRRVVLLGGEFARGLGDPLRSAGISCARFAHHHQRRVPRAPIAVVESADAQFLGATWSRYAVGLAQARAGTASQDIDGIGDRQLGAERAGLDVEPQRIERAGVQRRQLAGGRPRHRSRPAACRSSRPGGERHAGDLGHRVVARGALHHQDSPPRTADHHGERHRPARAGAGCGAGRSPARAHRRASRPPGPATRSPRRATPAYDARRRGAYESRRCRAELFRSTSRASFWVSPGRGHRRAAHPRVACASRARC